jgi:hypothetical protein
VCLIIINPAVRKHSFIVSHQSRTQIVPMMLNSIRSEERIRISLFFALSASIHPVPKTEPVGWFGR